MARCAWTECGRWRPDSLVRRGRFGVHFDSEWFCSSTCLTHHMEHVLEKSQPTSLWRPSAATRVGRLLVSQRAITPALLDVGLREQRHSGRRLGAQLVGMGLISRQELLRALATQAGTGYLLQLDPDRVADGLGGLSRDTVRALGLVPFEASPKGDRLAVACVAPVPRMALHALREISGARTQAFLVADEDWDTLAAAYATREAGERLIPSSTLRSIPDAAVRIAIAASQGAAVRMLHARCDPFMWVRLEGGSRREDLLVSLGSIEGGQGWPGAPTPH